jgi:hypothetical protein
MEDGHIVVDSILPIRLADITKNLARESGFSSVKDLLEMATHGRGDNVYLIRFRYLAPGVWDVQRKGVDRREDDGEFRADSSSRSRSDLLRRIRASTPPTESPDSTTPRRPHKAGRQR